MLQLYSRHTAQRTVCVPSVYSQHIPSVPSVYRQCTVSVHPAYRQCVVIVQLLFTQYTFVYISTHQAIAVSGHTNTVTVVTQQSVRIKMIRPVLVARPCVHVRPSRSTCPCTCRPHMPVHIRRRCSIDEAEQYTSTAVKHTLCTLVMATERDLLPGSDGKLMVLYDCAGVTAVNYHCGLTVR